MERNAILKAMFPFEPVQIFVVNYSYIEDFLCACDVYPHEFLMPCDAALKVRLLLLLYWATWMRIC